MATTTERILQSSNLESATNLIAVRELGLTADTERPVIGTSVGGPKFIGTEAIINIVTANPAALTLMRRSRTMCFVDTQAAGASVALDIQAGAQIAGYVIKVFVSGPDTRQCAVTYGVGLIEYIPSAMSQEFVWDGSKWNKTLMSWADRYNIGSYIESDVDETPSAKNPIVKLWDADHILDVANYPRLVPLLRAEKIKVWDQISSYVTDHSVTVSGNVITGSGAAWSILLTALVEDVIVQGGYSNYRAVNIAGNDFAISNIDTFLHNTITVIGFPATGAQTCIVYARRIAGSNTTARTYKDSGRATMSQDGYLRVAGLRRQFRMQGHYHAPTPATFAYNGGGTSSLSNSGGAFALNGGTIGAPTSDGINGTVRSGPETEPNSSAVYRSIWAGVLI
jgi:hypothetical protein